MDKDSLTTLLARGLSVEKIAQRFGKHPSTVSYWMAKYGLEAPNREKHAAKGGIEQRQLEALVNQGMSITELAVELDRSKATIRHAEARKCVLLCSNCHAEVEDGFVVLPDTISEGS